MFRLFVGDVHGNFKVMEQEIEKAMEAYQGEIFEIIQVGDMGYYPGSDPPPTVDFGVPQKFIRGNHEYHSRLPYKSHLIQDSFFGPWSYVPDGLIDENGVLYIGGAMSIDRRDRLNGPYKWFCDEQIDDWTFLDDLDLSRVNTVVTHAAPKHIVPLLVNHFIPNITAQGLQSLADRLDYLHQDVDWFFGHYHSYRVMRFGRIKYTLLNMSGRKGFLTLQEI